jgi:AraC-like DNA-binding protein
MQATDRHADYSQPAIWGQIAGLLDGPIKPRPSANCGRVQCEPGWAWRPRLADYDLWLAVRGRGTMTINGRAYPIGPGALFVLRPGDSGWATQEPSDRLTVAYLHIDFFSGGEPVALDPALLPARCVRFADPGPIDLLLSQVIRLAGARHPLAAVEARTALRQALIAIYQQDAQNSGVVGAAPDRRVERVVAQLRGAPEQRLSLDDAAAQAGLAPAYFSRLFTREMGESFRSFALRCRLEHARHLLDETTLSVGQVAAALGYDDLFLFSRQFKQHYGYAPSLMQRRAR